MGRNMKKLTAETILSGKLVSKPQPVSVYVLIDGEKCVFDTILKPFDYSTSVAQMRGIGENQEALADVLAVSIVKPNGEPEFTADQIRTNFSKELTDALWNKLVEVNAVGKLLKSNPKTNSSAKSPSEPRRRSNKSVKRRARTSNSGRRTQESTEVLTSGVELNKN